MKKYENYEERWKFSENMKNLFELLFTHAASPVSPVGLCPLLCKILAIIDTSCLVHESWLRAVDIMEDINEIEDYVGFRQYFRFSIFQEFCLI